MTRMISYAKVLPSLMRELQHLGDQEISCTPQLGPSVDQVEPKLHLVELRELPWKVDMLT